MVLSRKRFVAFNTRKEDQAPHMPNLGTSVSRRFPAPRGIEKMAIKSIKEDSSKAYCGGSYAAMESCLRSVAVMASAVFSVYPDLCHVLALYLPYNKVA